MPLLIHAIFLFWNVLLPHCQYLHYSSRCSSIAPPSVEFSQKGKFQISESVRILGCKHSSQLWLFERKRTRTIYCMMWQRLTAWMEAWKTGRGLCHVDRSMWHRCHHLYCPHTALQLGLKDKAAFSHHSSSFTSCSVHKVTGEHTHVANPGLHITGFEDTGSFLTFKGGGKTASPKYSCNGRAPVYKQSDTEQQNKAIKVHYSVQWPCLNSSTRLEILWRQNLYLVHFYVHCSS